MKRRTDPSTLTKLIISPSIWGEQEMAGTFMRAAYSFVWAFLATVLLAPASEAAEPTISSITVEGTNIVVKINAPRRVRKVTLEGRSRVEGSSWAPKALKRFDAATTNDLEITFTVPS